MARSVRTSRQTVITRRRKSCEVLKALQMCVASWNSRGAQPQKLFLVEPRVSGSWKGVAPEAALVGAASICHAWAKSLSRRCLT